jgi:hypothetical protein
MTLPSRFALVLIATLGLVLSTAACNDDDGDD